MPSKTRPYSELRLERLANPEVASAYLNATIENSPENFLAALMNVAKARQVSKVADEAGVQRETLYRSLSEQGNPTLDTLSSVLGAVGLRIAVSPIRARASRRTKLSTKLRPAAETPRITP